MTITAPAVEEQGRPENGSSLLADPWSDDWALPTTAELKAVGWPGARPGLVVDVREVESAPKLTVLQEADDQTGDASPERTLPQPEAQDSPADWADDDVITEPDRPVKRQRIRRHRRGLQGLRIGVAMVATAYWYFAVATLAIAMILPIVNGWRTTTVMSNSMAPTLSEGDVVAFAEFDGSLLDIGTIVQFEDAVREDSTITHRIIGFNADGTYETKGDANQGADSVKVAPSSITGVAQMVSPYAGLPHFWLATGQYLPLVAWIIATIAAAAAVMTPRFGGGRQNARSAPKVKKWLARLRPIRRSTASGQSEA
jgi:signal peptidase I